MKKKATIIIEFYVDGNSQAWAELGSEKAILDIDYKDLARLLRKLHHISKNDKCFKNEDE